MSIIAKSINVAVNPNISFHMPLKGLSNEPKFRLERPFGLIPTIASCSNVKIIQLLLDKIK
jgi:hypothetical protein